MTTRQNKKYWPISIFAWLLIFIFFTPILAPAGDAHLDVGNKLKIKEKTLNNLILTKFVENLALIDGSSYIFTSNTKFTSKERHGQIHLIKINEINKIMLPCLVDITYRTYSVYTESSPFYPGDRVLTSLFIKKQQIN
jgi:hypothetical protein